MEVVVSLASCPEQRDLNGQCLSLESTSAYFWCWLKSASFWVWEEHKPSMLCCPIYTQAQLEMLEASGYPRLTCLTGQYV